MILITMALNSGELAIYVYKFLGCGYTTHKSIQRTVDQSSVSPMLFLHLFISWFLCLGLELQYFAFGY